MARIVPVYIDEAVALFHLAGAGRDQVDAAPGGITHQRDAGFLHRGFEGPNVLSQVFV